jgi:site-specific DNA recombinase
MKTCAIYARVSTEEQVKNTSLRGQLDACRQHAVSRGYTVIKELAEDFSGARLDRPGLTELRDMAHSGEISALVVYEADRLSRKLGHLLLLQEEFDRLGAELLFVNSQDDTASPEGRMFFTMRGAFGEYEKEKITERFRLGKLRLAKQGKAISNTFLALGYTIQNGEYRIVEEEARLVRMIFEWAVRDRLSIRRIALRLTQMGARTKPGNTHWGASSVKNILDNPAYAGTAYWNRHMSVMPKKRLTRPDETRKNEKTSKTLRDTSEWIAIACPAIVSEELWRAAQKQLQANKERSPRRTKRNYLLRGLIKCGLCGYGYYGRGSRGFAYYYCGSRNTACRPGHKCAGKYLRADNLEERVWKYIRNQVTDEAALLATFERRGQMHAEEARRDQNALESLYAAEGKLKAEQNKMLDLYAQDIITLEQLQDRLAMLRKKQEGVDETKAETLAKLESRRHAAATEEALKGYCAAVREGMARAEAAGPDADYRREFLEMLDTALTIGEKDIEIEGIITGRLPLVEPDPRLLCSAQQQRLAGHIGH